MTFDIRSSVDYFGGALSTPAIISDTSLKSLAFQQLPADYASVGKYLQMTLYDDVNKWYEIVWIIGHGSNSDTITVARGRQGTTPRAWPANTTFVVAPTARDMLGATTLAGLPTDPYLGERVALTDKGRVVQRTKTAGWQADVGVALPTDIGPSLNGITPPADATMILRGGPANATWNGISAFAFNFPSPFPNGVSGIVLTSGSHLVRNVVRATVSTTGATVLAFGFDAQPIVSGSIALEFMALGW